MLACGTILLLLFGAFVGLAIFGKQATPANIGAAALVFVLPAAVLIYGHFATRDEYAKLAEITKRFETPATQTAAAADARRFLEVYPKHRMEFVKLMLETRCCSDTVDALVMSHADLETMKFLILSSVPGSEVMIVRVFRALPNDKTKEGAEILLNSGNPVLGDEAERWASEHGYTIRKAPGGTGARWKER